MYAHMCHVSACSIVSYSPFWPLLFLHFFLCFQVSSSPWLPVLQFCPCLSSCCSIWPPDLSSVWSVHPSLHFDGCPDAPSATLWQQRAPLLSFSCSLFVWLSFYSFFQPGLLIWIIYAALRFTAACAYTYLFYKTCFDAVFVLFCLIMWYPYIYICIYFW